jgi:uncharacterized phiE125 gp8 family phage protein
MAYEITAQPVAEPLSTEEVRQFLNLTSTDDDAMLGTFIQSAREWAEKTTGRAVISQAISQYWDTWPTGWTLGICPATEVTNIKYKDTNGDTQTWATSNYTADIVSIPARIWPTDNVEYPDLGNYPNAVWVEYLAGAAAPADVPADMKAGMLQKIAFLYENREDIPINESGNYRVRSADNLNFNNRIHLI